MDVSSCTHQMGERVSVMNDRPDVKHVPRRCPFLKKEVWAILMKQADGTWRVVNCLDKHEPCFEHDCAFTVDGGEWPFGA